jgi:CHAT domain-containing protein/tetratricopeptide (TPR) repeat protein
MDDQTLAELAQNLAVDEEAGFQQFRHLFFEALERRRLDECQALLEVLCAVPSPRLQRDCLYHRAIILSEQRQFDQAEMILRRLLEDDLSPVQRARALMELGIQLEEQGQWSEAERFFQQALFAYDAIQDDWGRARAFNNLGVTITRQVEQGQCDAVRLDESVSCHQAGLSLAEAVDDRWEVARNWHGLGRAYALLKQYGPALDAFEKDLALCRELDDPVDQAITLFDMAAMVYQPQSQWAEAAAALDEAIKLLRTSGDDMNLAEALTRRGNLLAEQGQAGRALASYDEAVALAESVRVRQQSPVAQAGYRTTVEFVYTAPLSLHLRQGHAARAFSAAERARSRVLADLLAGQTARPHAQIPAHLLEQRAGLRQALDQAYAEEKSSVDLFHVEKELADVDRQIELLDPAYAGLEAVASLTAEEVRDRLPSHSALLTYARDADDRLWILVVTAADVRFEPVKNVSARWLREYLADHLDGVRRGSLVPDEATGHLAPPRLFPPLFQALIAPVLDTLDAAWTVYVVPFGPLHYLPLGALTPDLNAPPPLLAEGRRVVYAPSATILLKYCHARPPSSNEGLLAVAPGDEAPDGLQFNLGAAETVARRADDRVLTGPHATRQGFLDQAGGYRALCFLGHAFFDQRHPMSSRLKLADGSLHASEILRELRLAADLVILSACETGRSHVLRGDEILGLSRAMLYAGTPSLLVTLWPVHEVPTRLLVERLVQDLPLADAADARFDPALTLASAQRWLRTLSYAEAERLLTNWVELSPAEVEAHLTGLWHMTHPGQSPQAGSQPFAHPFFWSPFILIGEGRRESANGQEA